MLCRTLGWCDGHSLAHSMGVLTHQVLIRCTHSRRYASVNMDTSKRWYVPVGVANGRFAGPSDQIATCVVTVTLGASTALKVKGGLSNRMPQTASAVGGCDSRLGTRPEKLVFGLFENLVLYFVCHLDPFVSDKGGDCDVVVLEDDLLQVLEC